MKVVISNYLIILTYKYTLSHQPNKFNMLREPECPKPTMQLKAIPAECVSVFLFSCESLTSPTTM